MDATTAAATDGWTGTVGCAGNNSEVWFQFTATGTNSVITVTNGTQTGTVEIILVSSTSACTGLGLVGSNCVASGTAATFAGLTIGTTYYATVSSTGSLGTFTICNTVTTPPPSPGQDCNDPEVVCGGTGFSVSLINLGDGAIEENIACIGNETSSQWYSFTASTSGPFNVMLDPAVWNSATETGDDYDWQLFQVAPTGVTSGSCSTMTSLACDYSACPGSTGYSPTAGAGFGQVGGTDYANSGGGPFGCSGGPQWNTTTVNLVAGQRYSLMIQNY